MADSNNKQLPPIASIEQKFSQLFDLAVTENRENKRLAAKGLADLVAARDDHKVKLVEMSGLKLLLSLAANERTEVATEALRALVSVAQKEEYRKKIVTLGVLRPVLKLSRNTTDLRSKSHIARLLSLFTSHAGCLSILTGSVGPGEWNEIVKLLSLYSTSTDLEVQRHASAAVSHLALSGSDYARLVEQLGLKAVLEMADSRCEANQRLAGNVLFHYAVEGPKHRSNIVKMNGIRQLIGLARSKSADVQQLGADIIGRLVMDDDLVPELVAEGGLEIVDFLANSEYLSVKLKAAGALASMAKDPHGAESLLKNKGVDLLLTLAFPKFVDVQRQVAMALSYLALDTNGVRLMLTGNGSLALNTLATCGDKDVQISTARALLAVVDRGDKKEFIRLNGIHQLVCLGRTPFKEVQLCVATALDFVIQSESDQGALDIMTEEAYHLLNFITRAPDSDVQRRGASVILKMSKSSEGRSKLIQYGFLPTLFFLTFQEDQGMHLLSSMILKNMGSEEECTLKMVNLGFLKSLEFMGQQRDLSIRRNLAATVELFSRTEKNRLQMVREGVIEFMVRLYVTFDPEIDEYISKAFEHLSAMVGNEGRIIDTGGLDLFDRVPDFEVSQEYLARSLLNLIANLDKSYPSKLGDDRFMKFARDFLETGNKATVLLSLKALGYLCRLDDNVERVQNYSILRLMMLQVEGANDLSMHAAIMNVVAQVSRIGSTRTQLAGQELWRMIVGTVKGGNVEGQRYGAITILNYLLDDAFSYSNTNGQMHLFNQWDQIKIQQDFNVDRNSVWVADRLDWLIEANLFQATLRLAESQDTELLILCAMIVQQIVDIKDAVPKFVSNGGLSTMVLLAKSSNQRVQFIVVNVIKSLLMYEDIKHDMSKSGILQVVTQLVKSKDTDVSKCALSVMNDLKLTSKQMLRRRSQDSNAASNTASRAVSEGRVAIE